ncbi:MAG: hypothetical protein PHR30_15625 [Gallionellaceae bacterium]|nr:hypothetical protein [Gallionellaceae bacterium]
MYIQSRKNYHREFGKNQNPDFGSGMTGGMIVFMDEGDSRYCIRQKNLGHAARPTTMSDRHEPIIAALAG